MVTALHSNSYMRSRVTHALSVRQPRQRNHQSDMCAVRCYRRTRPTCPTFAPPSFSRPPYGCAVSLHKEFQCILNLFVPEIPVVNSRFFNIFVSVADCIQMVTETDIAFIKEVFSSAGEKKFRAKR